MSNYPCGYEGDIANVYWMVHLFRSGVDEHIELSQPGPTMQLSGARANAEVIARHATSLYGRPTRPKVRGVSKESTLHQRYYYLNLVTYWLLICCRYEILLTSQRF